MLVNLNIPRLFAVNVSDLVSMSKGTHDAVKELAENLIVALRDLAEVVRQGFEGLHKKKVEEPHVPDEALELPAYFFDDQRFINIKEEDPKEVRKWPL